MFGPENTAQWNIRLRVVSEILRPFGELCVRLDDVVVEPISGPAEDSRLCVQYSSRRSLLLEDGPEGRGLYESHFLRDERHQFDIACNHSTIGMAISRLRHAAELLLRTCEELDRTRNVSERDASR